MTEKQMFTRLRTLESCLQDISMLCAVNRVLYCVNYKHMWQPRIEIEYYSVVYFERITEFDVV